MEVYAWGLRNPNGVKWAPDGQLYVTDNAYDERGSRPVANAKNNIFQIKQGGWWGWPAYSSGLPLTDPQFRPARGPKLKCLLKDHPPVEQRWMVRPENVAATKFDFSSSTAGLRARKSSGTGNLLTEEPGLSKDECVCSPVCLSGYFGKSLKESRGKCA